MKAMLVFAILVSLGVSMSAPTLAETRPEIGYGQSPTAAMKRVFTIARILRVNVVEPYAIVSAEGSGGLFKDAQSTEFLLQHFDFGWQVIDEADDICAQQRGISNAVKQKLIAGMPKRADINGRCDEVDSGPPRSISQVRKLMYGPVVPFVRVVENYAFSMDYGDGGGCGLFHFEDKADRWKLLGGCKGAMDPSIVKDNHIPLHIVCALGIESGPLDCPKRTKR